MCMQKEEMQRYYFGLFQKDYALPEGTIEYTDKPDIILHGSRKTGIEMTRFYLRDGSCPTSEQVQIKLRQGTVSRAQDLFRARNNGPMRLILGFDLAVPLESDISNLAEQIAEFAERIDGRKTGQVSKKEFSSSPELSFVWIADKGFGDRWTVMQVHTTPKMSIRRLREIVKDKETKARGYTSCDSYWLLVVMDFIDRAQDQNLHTEGFETVVSDVFDKMVPIRKV